MSEIPKAFKNKIINALRRLSYSWQPRNDAKRLAKIGPALFKCALCDCAVYEGSKKLEDIVLDNGDFAVDYFETIKLGKGRMDHIHPVIPPGDGWTGWEQYMAGIYSPIENWQHLCLDCDKKKTRQESIIRRQARQQGKYK